MRLPEQRVLTFSFPMSGVVTTLLGPLLPSLVARWSLTDAQAGQLFLAQFLSSTLGAVCSGMLAARVGALPLVAVAYILMGIGVALLGRGPFSTGFVCLAIYGFSLGVSIPTVNLLVALRSPGRQVAQVNLLNLAWCAGALIAPPIIAYIVRLGGLNAALNLVAGLCVISGMACALTVSRSRAATVRREAPAPVITRSQYRAAAAAGAFLFLYVGVENGLNGWLPLFAQRIESAGGVTSAFALSAFWTAVLLARLTAARQASRLSPGLWVLGGLTVAVLGICLLLSGWGGSALLIVGAAAAGLGLGPVFPTAVVIFQQSVRTAAAPLIGFVFAAAGCGGGAFPWLIGAVSSSSGSLRVGLATTLAAVAGMLITRRMF